MNSSEQAHAAAKAATLTGTDNVVGVHVGDPSKADHTRYAFGRAWWEVTLPRELTEDDRAKLAAEGAHGKTTSIVISAEDAHGAQTYAVDILGVYIKDVKPAADDDAIRAAGLS